MNAPHHGWPMGDSDFIAVSFFFTVEKRVSAGNNYRRLHDGSSGTPAKRLVRAVIDWSSSIVGRVL